MRGRRMMTCVTVVIVACLTTGWTSAEDDRVPRNPTQAKLLNHSVAGLAALNIYSSFGCIGLAADLFEAEKYDADKIQQVMSDTIKTSGLAIQMLKNVDVADKNEDVPIRDLIACYRLLEREAGLLSAAAKAKAQEKEKAMQVFYQAREESWLEVKHVLGIEDENKSKAENK